MIDILIYSILFITTLFLITKRLSSSVLAGIFLGLTDPVLQKNLTVAEILIPKFLLNNPNLNQYHLLVILFLVSLIFIQIVRIDQKKFVKNLLTITAFLVIFVILFQGTSKDYLVTTGNLIFITFNILLFRYFKSDYSSYLFLISALICTLQIVYPLSFGGVLAGAIFIGALTNELLKDIRTFNQKFFAFLLLAGLFTFRFFSLN